MFISFIHSFGHIQGRKTNTKKKMYPGKAQKDLHPGPYNQYIKKSVSQPRAVQLNNNKKSISRYGYGFARADFVAFCLENK